MERTVGSNITTRDGPQAGPATKPAIRVVHILEATTGGTRRHLFDLVTGLDPERFQASVICSTQRDKSFLDDIAEFRARGITVHVVRMVRPISPLLDLVSFLRILSIIRRERYSIVHTHSSKAGFIGRVAAGLLRVPAVIHTAHVFPFEMSVGGLRRAFYFFLERIAARFADRIICVCPCEKDDALQRRLSDESKFVVIENGSALPEPVPDAAGMMRRELGLDADSLVIGAVGRFARQKGYRYLVLAAREIAQRLPRARFVLVGDGKLRAEVEHLIERLGLAGKFVLTGRAADARPYYPVFDVFVMASLWEGMPYSLLEAMGSGSAVVATRVGGVADVVSSGETGVLVAPKDPMALAAAVIDLLEHPEQRRALAETARRTVADRYAPHNMVRRVEALYEACLEAPTARS